MNSVWSQRWRRDPQFETIVCVTGQHREMLRQVLESFEVVPDYDLDIMKSGQSLYDVTDEVLWGMKKIYEKERPDFVLVHGDTTTAFSSALAAFYSGIKIGHVEAGLRTYDIHSPYPEEFNRQAIGSMADWHFAPTDRARENLVREGKSPERIYVTGNTAIDALKTTVQKDYRHPLLDWAEGSRLVVLTAHRRENLGGAMRGMFEAVREVAEENPKIKILYPVHPNPKVGELARRVLSGCQNIRLVPPFDVVEFHNIMARAYLMLTDSGGIQEEAPALGKPVLVLRDTTERPEGMQAGTLKLTGTEKESVKYWFTKLLQDEKLYTSMSRAVNPYGDGKASRRIAEVLKSTKES